jgi:hypothetical protein
MAISNKYSTARPSLYLNFYKSRQLDPRASLTRASTGTYIDVEGIVRTAGPNEPRFDYENGECKGLLVEQSSTNLFLYSNDPSYNAIVQGSSTTSNYAIAPDGTLTATRWKVNSELVDPGNSAYTVRMYKGINSAAGQKVTQSIFVKPVSVISRYINPPDTVELDRDVYITLSADQGGSGSFNLKTFQTVGSIEVQQLSNEWYRISNSYIVTNNDSVNNHFINLGNRAGSFDPYPDGSEEVYIWGWQVEQSPSVTSYIPTTSTTVTRAADKVTINDLSWFDNNEGTFVVNTNLSGITTTTTLFSVDNGTSQIIYNATKVKVGTGKTLYNPILTSEDTQRIVGYSSSKNLVITSSSDEPAFFSTTTGSVSGMNRLAIGWDPLNSSNYLNGPLKSLRYYPTLLDDNQLKSLVKINQDQTIDSIGSSYDGLVGIATTGLVLLLDAGDPRSSSGEGNIWYDLSGRNNHATLDGVRYTSANSGYMAYDGKYGRCTASVDHSVYSSSTLEIVFNMKEYNKRLMLYGYYHNWFYYNPPSGGIFLESAGEGGSSVRASVITSTQTYRTVTHPSKILKNQTHHVVLTKDTIDGKLQLFVNGVASNIQTFDTASFAQWPSIGNFIGVDILEIGKGANTLPDQNWNSYLKGKIFIARSYGRILSSSEILQNYNALKGRFGL